MKNPPDELRSYLEKLVNRYLNINSLRQQLNSISEWTTNAKSPDNIEAFNLASLIHTKGSLLAQVIVFWLLN